MQENLQKYTQSFLSLSLLKKSFFSLAYLKNTSIILFLILSSKMQPCDEFSNSENVNTFSFSKEDRLEIIKNFNMSDGTIRKNLNELEKFQLIKNIEKDKYIINPHFFVTGSKDSIQRVRNYVDSQYYFFQTSEKETKEDKFNYIFNSMSNLKRYNCFTSANDSKMINKTELSVFLMLAAECKDCKYAQSPELCNTITIDSALYKKLSKILDLDERSLRRAVSNLCKYHLFHKFEKVDNKYMINPFIAARGKIDDVRALQIKLMSDKKYKSFFDGFAQGDFNEAKKTKSEIVNITMICAE